MHKKNIFITGAAGYVGAMLVEQYLRREDVGVVIGLDKEEPKDILLDVLEEAKYKDRIVYLKHDMSEAGWEAQVAKYKPEIVVHTAWQIREIYGNRALSYKWNIDGSDRVFDFAFQNESVRKLIHFSTVASYGAYESNTRDHFFTEEERLRESSYLYAEEKRWCEEHLEKKYASLAPEVRKRIEVYIVRPAAITGPRGRMGRIRFGLQSALSGSLKGTSLVNNLVTLLTSYVPVTPNWLRQYIHEDDVTDIVSTLAFDKHHDLGEEVYEAFNISPDGECVLGVDMARAVGKKAITIHPYVARLGFYVLWHLTRGRVPTGPGVWKGYSYPIAVDGSKITKLLGYKYKYNSMDAFTKKEGRYSYLYVK